MQLRCVPKACNVNTGAVSRNKILTSVHFDGYLEYSCSERKEDLACVEIVIFFFYILLTVQPCKIFCKQNQLGAQIFLICLLLFSTCFEQLCTRHQEKIPYLCDTWYLSLYIDDCLVCRAAALHTRQSSVYIE